MFFTPERNFLLFCVLGGYFFGLIQSAFFFSKIKKINLRYHGSGNYGTTNAWRVLGWQWGILTFICDILKTGLAIYIAFKVLPLFPQLSIDSHALVLYTGLGVIIGHIFPFYLKFRGGKGVACAFATIVMLSDIKVLGVAVLIFLLVFLISRYVSLASLSMVFFSALAFMICMLMRWTYVEKAWIADCQVVFCIIFLMVLIAHRSNIVHLIFGEERKFYFRKRKRIEAAEEDYTSYDKYTAEVEAATSVSEASVSEASIEEVVSDTEETEKNIEAIVNEEVDTENQVSSENTSDEEIHDLDNAGDEVVSETTEERETTEESEKPAETDEEETKEEVVEEETTEEPSEETEAVENVETSEIIEEETSEDTEEGSPSETTEEETKEETKEEATEETETTEESEKPAETVEEETKKEVAEEEKTSDNTSKKGLFSKIKEKAKEKTKNIDTSKYVGFSLGDDKDKSE